MSNKDRDIEFFNEIDMKHAEEIINRVNNSEESMMFICFDRYYIRFTYNTNIELIQLSKDTFDEGSSYFSKQYKHYGEHIRVLDNALVCGTTDRFYEFHCTVLAKVLNPREFYDFMQECKN